MKNDSSRWEWGVVGGKIPGLSMMFSWQRERGHKKKQRWRVSFVSGFAVEGGVGINKNKKFKNAGTCGVFIYI